MPRYKHDCELCKPLGEYKEFDLYYCPQGRLPTVIARFGDDGPNYVSGMFSLLPELEEARRRAKEKGYIKC